MKRPTRLAALVVITVAALAPVTALSPGRALAGTATAASPARLWVAYQYVKREGFNLAVAASLDGSAVFAAGEVEKLNRKGTNATVTAVNSTTGAQLWQTSYTASPNSGFSFIAVSPDGSEVFAAAAAEPAGYGVAVSPDSSKVYVTGDTTTYGTTIGYAS
jgi:outer membrane protein assembly factor BamB